MKILLVSNDGLGPWFAWLMRHEGHDVEWHQLKDDPCWKGIIPPPRKRLPPASSYDLIVFDCSGKAEIAEEAAASTLVIGSHPICDALEDDRVFGIEAMEAAGIRVPPWEGFDRPQDAIKWLQKTHKRTVLKPLGDAPSEMTYVAKNEADMIAFIEKRLPGSKVKQFLLQEFVEGTEISTEAWWTGTEWVALAHTLEEKKLMPGNIGPNTGCAGNVYWMPLKPTPVFQQGLEKISPLLVDAGYRGSMDLNAIVTEGTVFGLEWTPRFGYEGTCNLTTLLPMGFAEFMDAIAHGITPPNLIPRHAFTATIRLGVPPYPSKGCPEVHQPIEGLPIEDLTHFFLSEIDREGDDYFVVGEGCVGAPIGCAETISGAFDAAKALVKSITVPDLMWRNDSPHTLHARYNVLEHQGWLRPIG